jgi:hypothetical protein
MSSVDLHTHASFQCMLPDPLRSCARPSRIRGACFSLLPSWIICGGSPAKTPRLRLLVLVLIQNGSLITSPASASSASPTRPDCRQCSNGSAVDHRSLERFFWASPSSFMFCGFLEFLDRCWMADECDSLIVQGVMRSRLMSSSKRVLEAATNPSWRWMTTPM